MEVDKRYLQEDLMSDRRSFGSTCHPSSQARKISIGIMVDPLLEKRYGASKENLGNIVNSKMENSRKGNSGEGEMKGEGVFSANEALEQVNNPTMATCFLNKSQHTSRTVPATARNPKLDCNDENLKTLAGDTGKRNGERDEGLKRVEKFMTPQDAFMSDKVKTKATPEDKTASLRMKLFEILGTVSSPKSQPSHDSDVDDTDVMPKQPVNRRDETVIESKQKSENKETPAHTLRRPVTRSLTAKKVSTRKNLDKGKAGLSSSLGHTNKGKAVLTSSRGHTFQPKNIFSFDDGMSGRGKPPAHVGSTSTKKNNQRNNFTFEPCKINFSENNKVDGIKGATYECEASTPVGKSTSVGNNSRNSYVFPHLGKSGNAQKKNKYHKRDSYDSPGTDLHLSQERSGTNKPGNNDRSEGQEKGLNIETQKRDQEKDSCNSPHRNSPSSQRLNGMHQPENLNCPIVPETHVENFSSPSPKIDVYSEEDCQSPTFRFNSPIINSFPNITPKTDQIKQVFCSHKLADGSIGLQNISSFKDLHASRLDDYNSDAETELSKDEAEAEDNQQSKPLPCKGKEDSEDGLSKSSSSSEESESSDEDSPVLKESTAERSKVARNQGKRLRRNEASRVGKLTPTSPSPQAVRENDWSPGPLEQNEGDELERVVTLFALAVKNFQNKMKLTVRKKSSEILNSVTEEIRMQFQKIESQIQTDMGKLTNASKSKRKRLEAGLQEQEEQLRLIHDKFKQDIGRYLEECKGTLEELQMHQDEFKGAIKKQKASHQKLIVQAEKAIEAQLIDADKRITDAHKLARRKMAALKHVIGQCLSEDVLC